MNEWTFYDGVFEVSKDLLNYYVVPYAVRRVILEIDEALRKWRADEKNDDLEKEDEDYRKIDSRKLSEIYEIFADRARERDKYLDVFPEYKENTLDIINELTKEGESLEKQIESLELPNDVANFAGALSGGIRLLTIGANVCPALSVALNTASVASGAIRSVTTIAELGIRENHLGKAIKLIGEHKTSFKKMSRWFTYDDCLTKSVQAAIGSETTKKLFQKFKVFYENLENFKDNHPTATNGLKMIKVLSEVLLSLDFKAKVAYSVTAGLLQIFWIHYGSCWISDWNVGARAFERLKTLSVAGMYMTHTYFAWRRFQNPTNSFYSNSPVGAAIGIAIDLIPPLLELKKKKGKPEDYMVKNIKNVVSKLKDEVNLFQEVYNTLYLEKELKND